MTKEKTYPAPSLLDMKRITTHPGEMLKEEFLKPLGMSARALAHEIDVPPQRLTEIIAGRRRLTADTAIRLSRYFGVSAEFWMNLQSNHDLTKAVVEKRKTYSKIQARRSEVETA
jgi:antitoxin HigA-1